MNNEEEGYERFMRDQIGRHGKIALMLIVIHTCLREYENDPTKPFSGAFATASFGYAIFQLAHFFARRPEYPRFVLFDIISIFLLYATIVIAFAAIFFN